MFGGTLSIVREALSVARFGLLERALSLLEILLVGGKLLRV